MATQLQVYLTKLDEELLIQQLQVEFGVQLLRVVFFHDDEFLANSVSALSKYTTDAQIALAKIDFLSATKIDVYPEGHRRLHTQDSSVIQFTRSITLSDNRLKPGRFVYYPSGPNGKKDKLFLRWAKSIFAHLKTLKERQLPIHSYIGNEAAALVSKGDLTLTIC